MISEVDDVLRSLLLPTGAGVRFDLPGPDRTSGPTVSLLLHRVEEDRDARHNGWIDQRDGKGHVVSRREFPRRYRLDYLATVWAADVAAEHVLLGHVLYLLDGVDVVQDDHLTAALRSTGEPVQLEVAAAGPVVAQEWAVLGVAPRPVLVVRAFAVLVRPAQSVPPAPHTLDMGVAGGLPARPPEPPRPRPDRRIREAAE